MSIGRMRVMNKQKENNNNNIKTKNTHVRKKNAITVT